MRNEVRCELVCSNLVCLNKAMDKCKIGVEFPAAALEAAALDPEAGFSPVDAFQAQPRPRGAQPLIIAPQSRFLPPRTGRGGNAAYRSTRQARSMRAQASSSSSFEVA